MDKYTEFLTQIPDDFLHIVKSFVVDNNSSRIEPAHIFRALLHKNVGLIDLIENRLDSDYYYLLDWADMRLRQTLKSAYPMKEICYSDEAKSVIREAKKLSDKLGPDCLSTYCLLAAIVSPGVGFTADQLKTLPLTSECVIQAISGDEPKNKISSRERESFTTTSDERKEDRYYTELVEELPHLPILGLDDKIRSMVEVLSRKDKANVIIVGEPGVGKSSLIYGLLQRINDGSLPASLKNLYPVELDLIAITQGVSYKGEIEDRFKKLVNEISRHSQPVLVVENFHRIEDKQSLLNSIVPIIKKEISKGKLQLICTSTVEGFTKDIEKDKELLSFFEKISVEEPSESDSIRILKSKIPTYVEFHKVEVEEGVAEEIVRLSKRYIPEYSLPSSAIDLLDRSMASVKIKLELSESASTISVLNKDYVKDVVSTMTGIPMGNVQSEERIKLSNAEEILHRRVVGQNHAVKSILDAIYESRSGLNKKGQPIGSFFFLGPTGTGKTELAKALAEFLFDDETSILRFDMSEYKEEHSVSLLYGAPPGYVGYEEGGLLVNQIRRHPYSVVLFDEIEKAHRSVFDLFLQILDEGKLHDRLGRVGDFSNALIIFTSNIGSDYIFQSFEANRIPTHDQMLEVMQGQFRPEFLARLTEIIPFSPITESMIYKIFDIHIKNLMKSLHEQDIKLEIDDTAKQYITKVGFNTHYGARPVLGIIRKEIRRPLSKMIIAGDVVPGDTVIMKHDMEKNEMVWEID
ncbi:ATP-dependent Clp protease ATP-binding subunit [Barnesiella sp. An22]|uniref:AAA family ATPase n=1 Tax=Barnesiella sp. An22 TaxID=1965590 RepID=UPI000B3874FF|nr:ATP-dependent Clp protease ATP-binding subunit [Barnesiella sp. An22]OUO99711.1 hypothetical protein B5F38_02505 [Barnesiella sp. An22]